LRVAFVLGFWVAIGGVLSAAFAAVRVTERLFGLT
jgi:hypothetical protein